MNLILQRVKPGEVQRSRDIGRVVAALEDLPEDKGWRISIDEIKPVRTLSQNSLLWHLYDEALKQGGELLSDFTKEELHQLCLGEHFGWERVRLFGKARVRPVRTSSKLNKREFGDFVDFVVRYFAEKGIVLSLPGDL